MNIFIESGKKKVFVGALDWPGLCRFFKDASTVLEPRSGVVRLPSDFVRQAACHVLDHAWGIENRINPGYG